ncbi:hypothetical protein KTO58_08770 [Chitinophaga pendula]|uniref:hypothetical protein n=1 Tax=Chitinophaga TaxID=79328 RepID=UPI0012FE0D9B|nr:MULTISPECIES: hypothetical protein [Chitinophaga]UCJ09261.1 hypothetical protein KTO58_08770 [Chitinophaga pendula]
MTFTCLIAVLYTFAQQTTQPRKTIAILPVKTGIYMPTREAQTVAERMQSEHELSIYGQSLIYKALVNEDISLLVNVQHWEHTDSLLRKAGIEFRKVNFLDKQSLCQYLQVDEVVTGDLKTFSKSTIYVGPTLMSPIMSAYHYFDGKKVLTIGIHDGKTGDLIWIEDIHLKTNKLLRTEQGDESRLMTKFLKAFPYLKS